MSIQQSTVQCECWPEKHWLDPIIKEQAAHYGLTVQQHAVLMNDAATQQEQHETNQTDN